MKTKAAELKDLKAHKEMLDAKQATLAIEDRHSTALQEMGKDLIQDTVKLGEKYFGICKYIRANMVPPKLVSFELDVLGFHRVTISKINKVANASDELFSEFEAKTIGFNKVLELARGETVINLAKSMGTDVVDIKAQIDETKPEGKKADSEKTPEQLEAQNIAKWNRLCVELSKLAALMDIKGKPSYNAGHGYIISIRVDKNFESEETVVEQSLPL